MSNEKSKLVLRKGDVIYMSPQFIDNARIFAGKAGLGNLISGLRTRKTYYTVNETEVMFRINDRWAHRYDGSAHQDMYYIKGTTEDLKYTDKGVKVVALKPMVATTGLFVKYGLKLVPVDGLTWMSDRDINASNAERRVAKKTRFSDLEKEYRLAPKRRAPVTGPVYVGHMGSMGEVVEEGDGFIVVKKKEKKKSRFPDWE